MIPVRNCLLSILATSFLLVSVVHAEVKKQTLPVLKKKIPAPYFELMDIDGKLHKLTDYKGSVVILNFWATWCPPCRYEMPSMDRARKILKGEKIVILAIDVGEDEDTIFEFTGNYPVEFPLLMDPEAKTIKQYPVVGLPTTYIIDPHGYITHKIVGSREWDDPQLLDKIRKLQN